MPLFAKRKAKVAETSGFSALIFLRITVQIHLTGRDHIQVHRHSWHLLTASSHLTHLIAPQPDLGGTVRRHCDNHTLLKVSPRLSL